MQSLRCRELCLSPYRSLRHTPAAPHATRHFVFEVVVCAGGSGVWGVGLAFGCCCAFCLPLASLQHTSAAPHAADRFFL